MGEIKPTPLDKAADRLGVVCADQAFKLRASIPGRTDDDDVVIGQGIVWARERIEHLEADRDRVGGIAKQRYAEIRGLKEDAREFDYVTMKLRGLLLFAKSARPREIVEAVVSTWYARLEVEGRQRKQLAEANATIERLTSENINKAERIAELERGQWAEATELRDRRGQVDHLQQIIDECIVAAGSGGLMASDLPKRIAELRGGQLVPQASPFKGGAWRFEPDRKPRPAPPNLAGMTLEQAAKARMALGDGTFEDIDCFIQAMREEVADCANYWMADVRRNGETPVHEDAANKLRALWIDLRDIETHRKAEKTEVRHKPDTDGWQPIETAPKDGTGFVGMDAINKDRSVSWWDDGEWRSHLCSSNWFPTHWMPMPDSPAREGER
ncbi:MAG: hypothetical protein ACPGVY_13855 [Mycobacterium sp.]